MDTGYYLKPIKKTIPEVNFFLNKYNNTDFKECRKYENSIHQHYKILDCYNLYRNEKDESDFIIRIRLDVIITQNILEMLSLLKGPLQIICSWDFVGIGTPAIMHCYCSGLENKYGSYRYETITPEIVPIMNDYNHNCKKRWTYAAERQLFEMLFEYCNQNKLDVNSAIKYISCSEIVRVF